MYGVIRKSCRDRSRILEYYEVQVLNTALIYDCLTNQAMHYVASVMMVESTDFTANMTEYCSQDRPL